MWSGLKWKSSEVLRGDALSRDGEAIGTSSDVDQL